MNNDVFSRTNGDGSFCRENGGDQILYSTVSGVVTCHANMSLKIEINLYTADPHHYRLMLGILPLIVVGAGYRLYRQMTTGLAQLFGLRLTAGFALLRLLNMAARHVGSSLTPEDAPHFGWRLKLR